MFKQREHRRIKLEQPVDVSVNTGFLKPSAADAKINCTTCDASICGLQLYSDKYLDADEEVKLHVDVVVGDRQQSLDLLGKVRWSRPEGKSGVYRVGIRLCDETNPSMMTWRKAIADRIGYSQT